uniref:putative disease resistance RPP13-like protein 1 n=1 Tax=Erigeron canadensis TaxID=72917 RepID=UPI001CB9306C|nr:putative disease resistance RPP13-like protein 1 [Erigeron canadensis]XP_043634701.1 putative disease resistance RPP13-like protein 1 [Erigeron canadensis]
MDVDFLGVFITMLMAKLSDYTVSEHSNRSAGIKSDHLDRWKEALVSFQSLFAADTGCKKALEESLGQPILSDWLHGVQDLGHHIYDLLDGTSLNEESNYASSKNKVLLDIIPTACSRFNASSNNHISEADMITEQLVDYVNKMNELRLVIVRSDKASTPPIKFTHLLRDRSPIVGLEKDREALLHKLLVDDEACKQNVNVVSVVGMGGIGKTTLAKTLYYDDKVTQHFDIRAWVSVSVTDNFNVFRISQAIYYTVDAQHIQDPADLNLLQTSLKRTFFKKRFLLVIDNVWNVKNTEWELFQGPFALAAAPGSKFIVTTRNPRVASATNSVVAYPLEVLPDEEALSLFAQNALGKPNFDSHPTLKLHGESIVKRCDGLPLALVSLGMMLHTERSDKEWKKLLIDWISNVRNEILPTLKLSYNGLPPHLKQMFAYCSLFPKDYVFNKKELVLMWMALGFLYFSNTNKSPEHLGHECFEELESKHFFQIEKSSGYKMNYMINDLATSVGEEYFYRLDDQMDTKEDLEKVHHFSFTRQRFGVYKKFKALKKVRRLQTFLAVSVSLQGRQNLFLLNNILVELLPQLQFLRVLSLTNYSITELPQSVSSLKHMCYLNCSQTNITYLPEAVAELYNLQSLLLRGCRKLDRLPHSFVKLEHLRHLDISDTPMLKKIPLGIEKLTKLQTLSKVIIEETNGFKLSDLYSLVNLQGHLSIEGLQKVKDASEARGANLQQMNGLEVLELEWSDVGETRNEITDQEVLTELRPHDKLKSLKILFYSGDQFPSWIGDSSFVQLTEISLSGCRSCTDLPTLGHLGSLEKLFVESMDKVKTIRFDLPGSVNSSHVNAFPSLKVLEFKDMQNWEEWLIHGGDKDGTTTLFPSLREIYVSNCPNLAVVSFGSGFPSLDILEFKNMQGWKEWSGTTASFPHLRQISLVNCLKLVVSIKSMPSLHQLHIQKCSIAVLSYMVGLSSSIVSLTVENIKELTHLPKEVLEHLGEVTDLCIKWCDQMTYLWVSESEAGNFLVRLQNLDVFYCKNLVSLSQKGVNLDSSMKSVNKVRIRDCERLKNYDCPKSIEWLEIWNCSSLASLDFIPTVEETSSTLKFLDIQRCYNLEENWLSNNFLSPLESLEMVSLVKLRYFPEERFLHITKLIIRACDNIKSIPDKGFGSIPLRRLEIIHCKNLNSLPYQQLTSLTSMEELVISHCPLLDDTFPCGSWPPNLSILTIGGLNKPMSKWGTQNFPPSLVTLYLHGQNAGVDPFAEADSMPNFYLPKSLTFLEINGFVNLKSLSKGLQHLTSLEGLVIDSCPKLVDLPPEELLEKLLSLKVYYCPKLQQKCHSKKGNYRHILSQIPELYV